MKRRLLILCLLLVAVPLVAEKRCWVMNAFATQTGTGATSSIHAITDASSYPTFHTVQLVVVSASVCQYSLEGSIDNSNWFTIGQTSDTTEADCTSSMMFHVANRPVRYIRGNLTSITGTSVTMTYLGEYR